MKLEEVEPNDAAAIYRLVGELAAVANAYDVSVNLSFYPVGNEDESDDEVAVETT